MSQTPRYRVAAMIALAVTASSVLVLTSLPAAARSGAGMSTTDRRDPSSLRWFIDRPVTIRLKDDLPPLDVPLSASSAVNDQNRTVLGTLVDTDEDWLYLRCTIRFGGENITDIVAIRSERVATIASRE